MPDEIDWDLERTRAASQTQASLIALARRAGFEVDESKGKGSHAKVTRPSLARPIIIPRKIYRINAQHIIDSLREGLE